MSPNQSSLNLELLFDGHEALLTPTKKIKKITKKDIQVANEMHKIMRANNGVGLSANQVGYDRSIIVMSIGPDNYTMFNPEIVRATSDIIKSTEGCLSFPGVQCEVYRAARVLAKWQDSKGRVKIKWLDGLAGVCIQHECLPHDARVETDVGLLKIKEIVDKKMFHLKIKSFNSQTNSFEFVKIASMSVKKNEEKKSWISLNLSKSGKNRALTCTTDHPIATSTNPFYFDNNYIEAKDALNKFVLTNSKIKAFSFDQLSLLVGSLLGDGSISSKGEFIIVQKNINYLKHLQSLLGGKIKTQYSGYSNKYNLFKLVLPVNEQTKELRKLFYTPKKKINTSFIEEFITQQSLASWFMEDGTLIKNNYAQIHTEGFNYLELTKLVKIINSKFNLFPSIYKRKIKDKDMYYLYFKKEESFKFFNLIKTHIIADYQYKLPNSFKNNFQYNNVKKLDYGISKIYKINKSKKESKLYDLGLVNNNNFLSNNVLVHNCDHLAGRRFVEQSIEFLKEKNAQLQKETK